jgi:hypothetical protein
MANRPIQSFNGLKLAPTHCYYCHMRRIRPEGGPSTTHLQQDQFFHVAPSSARQDIDTHGIDHTRGTSRWINTESGPGNFLWTSQRNATQYRHGAKELSRSDSTGNWTDISRQNYDIYEVTLPKVQRPKLENDPEFMVGEAVKTDQPLPRRFVRRIL